MAAIKPSRTRRGTVEKFETFAEGDASSHGEFLYKDTSNSKALVVRNPTVHKAKFGGRPDRVWRGKLEFRGAAGRARAMKFRLKQGEECPTRPQREEEEEVPGDAPCKKPKTAAV